MEHAPIYRASERRTRSPMLPLRRGGSLLSAAAALTLSGIALGYQSVSPPAIEGQLAADVRGPAVSMPMPMVSLPLVNGGHPVLIAELSSALLASVQPAPIFGPAPVRVPVAPTPATLPFVDLPPALPALIATPEPVAAPEVPDLENLDLSPPEAPADAATVEPQPPLVGARNIAPPVDAAAADLEAADPAQDPQVDEAPPDTTSDIPIEAPAPPPPPAEPLVVVQSTPVVVVQPTPVPGPSQAELQAQALAAARAAEQARLEALAAERQAAAERVRAEEAARLQVQAEARQQQQQQQHSQSGNGSRSQQGGGSGNGNNNTSGGNGGRQGRSGEGGGGKGH
jgi:hypothetical protein